MQTEATVHIKGEPHTIQMGTQMILKYNTGTIRARVRRITRNGKIYVNKFFKRSQRWSGLIKLDENEIVGLAL